MTSNPWPWEWAGVVVSSLCTRSSHEPSVLGSCSLKSLPYIVAARMTLRQLTAQTARRASSLAFLSDGRRMLTSRAMIAMTTRSSMSVKPFGASARRGRQGEASVVLAGVFITIAARSLPPSIPKGRHERSFEPLAEHLLLHHISAPDRPIGHQAVMNLKGIGRRCLICDTTASRPPQTHRMPILLQSLSATDDDGQGRAGLRVPIGP